MITLENRRTDRLLYFKFSEKYTQIDPYDFLETFQKDDWSVQLNEMLGEFFWTYSGNEKKPKEWLKKRAEIVKMVEELMKANLIALGSSGKNWDEERKETDYAIIHHTSTKHNAKFTYIDALCLLRLYAKSYSRPENSEFQKPIWSNHIMNGKQTFIPYHYIILGDGSFERCLKDEMIGWHSGDWEMNCRSIAIAFMDDLENSKPTEQAMKTAINILKKYNIEPENILGHREINQKTTCPSKKFFEWKYELTNGKNDVQEKLQIDNA